ncbi:MAG: hypothetical protein JWO05_2261 [Gemmatimonadetes bacterium]|nr:hypothetical protein [Gemmatimonadota bacterium]
MNSFPTRRLLALAAALPLSAAALGAQGFHYAPGTSQYRITSSTHGAQEVMGQKQEYDVTGMQRMTVALVKKAGDSLAVDVTMDSITMQGPQGPTPGMEKMIGSKFTGAMSVNGKSYGMKSALTEESAEQMAIELASFIPSIPANLKAGTTWTDTLASKFKQMGIAGDRKRIATMTVVGDTTVNGEKGWKVNVASNTTMTGSGEGQAGAMTLEAASTGTGVFVVSQAGTYLGGTNDDDTKIKVVIAANGMEVAVTQKQTGKVEKVK